MSAEIVFIGGIITLVGGAIPIWLWVRPAVKRSAAVADAILGEEAVRDRAGKEIQSARPGLVSRVGAVETTLALLVETNARLNDHDARIKTLETAAVERIVMHAENAAVLGLVGDEMQGRHNARGPEIEGTQ